MRAPISAPDWESAALSRLATILLLFLWLPGQSVGGDIYKWVDEYGQVHYGDTPSGVSPGARMQPELVNPGPGNIIANPSFNGNRIHVPFTEQGTNMIVEGRVNGIAARFIVDTGASLMIIPPALAERAGIATAKASQISLLTAGGTIAAPMVSLDDVKIGSAGQKNVAAAVHELGIAPGLGLLGMSFLDRYKMTVDREGRSLLLERR